MKKLLFLSASVAAMAVLTACDEDRDRQYDTEQDCTSSQSTTCTRVFNPVQMTQRNAPRFRSIADCESAFGSGNCQAPEGRISAIFSSMDSCENIYGEGKCRPEQLAMAEEDERGNSRTSGFVRADEVPLMRDTTQGVNQETPQKATQHAQNQPVRTTPVFWPLFMPGSTYYYPHTLGYYGGGPISSSPPPRMGGSYFVNSRTAQTSLGSTTYSGPRPGTVSSPSSSGGPKAGSVGSTASSRAGGVGSTGSGASS